jgi:hypothetical protein
MVAEVEEVNQEEVRAAMEVMVVPVEDLPYLNTRGPMANNMKEHKHRGVAGGLDLKAEHVLKSALG